MFNKRNFIEEHGDYYHISFQSQDNPECQISSDDTDSQLNSDTISLTSSLGNCGIKSHSYGEKNSFDRKTVYKQTIIITTRASLGFVEDTEWDVQCEVPCACSEEEPPPVFYSPTSFDSGKHFVSVLYVFIFIVLCSLPGIYWSVFFCIKIERKYRESDR